MEYYFNELDPISFQRLVGAILVARFGDSVRLRPFRGPDGGRDVEADVPESFSLSYSPRQRLQKTGRLFSVPSFLKPQPGRYVFQVKFHRTTDARTADLRRIVLRELRQELIKVVSSTTEPTPDYFILITNVPGSLAGFHSVNEIQPEYGRKGRSVKIDIWWAEHVSAALDLLPNLWLSWPQLFPGRQPPLYAQVAGGVTAPLALTVRAALAKQYSNDENVRFRQIKLTQELARLFVDLPLSLVEAPTATFISNYRRSAHNHFLTWQYSGHNPSAIEVLLGSRGRGHGGDFGVPRILLEGGPGQGKSTLTQMVAQIYRSLLLGQPRIEPEGRWHAPLVQRLPVRVELKLFAEDLNKSRYNSLDEYLAALLAKDSGGASFTVNDLHQLFSHSPVILLLDGLDEVGGEELRGKVLEECKNTIDRTEGLDADLRVVLTSRPPAVAGRRHQLEDFWRVQLQQMKATHVREYVRRWTTAQLREEEERERVAKSFEDRARDSHVDALSKNPMQLSVLLHFIYLKGEAFPDRRAELYRDYFSIIIDRDVEKSVELRRERQTVEALHRFLGFLIHMKTAKEHADGSIGRRELLSTVGEWLDRRQQPKEKAERLFRLGEERLGLIVVLRGEGEQSRYGFEIQPIREYFAAAHVNDDMEISASNMFRDMLRFPFWREVALFLAGLRRPNEKADLVAQCRELDREPAQGWRQLGREASIQLLREGVFAEPPHVLADVVTYILELLDDDIVRAHLEPRGFRQGLSEVIGQRMGEAHQQQVERLAERYRYQGDVYKYLRALQAAESFWSQEKIRAAIHDVQSTSDRVRALAQISWPVILQIDGVLDSCLAKEELPKGLASSLLWQAILTVGQGHPIKMPNADQRIFLKFLTVCPLAPLGSVWGLRKTSERCAETLAQNPCFALVTLFVGLFAAAVDPRPFLEGKINRKLWQACQNTSLENLTGKAKSLVAECLELVGNLLKALEEGDKDLMWSEIEHSRRIMETKDSAPLEVVLLRLRQALIVGDFLDFLLDVKADIFVTKSGNMLRKVIEFIKDTQNIEARRYDLSVHAGSGNFWDLVDVGRMIYVRKRRGFAIDQYFLPNRISTAKGELAGLDLIEVILRDGGKELGEGWSLLPLGQFVIRDVIEGKVGSDLEVLLEGIGKCNFLPLYGGGRLQAKEIHKTAAIARRTESREVRRGALRSLAGSRILNICEPELMERLLLEAGEEPVYYGRLLFGASFGEDLERQVQLARRVVLGENVYPLGLACVAASFLGENTSMELDEVGAVLAHSSEIGEIGGKLN